jgi:hypothetical protein
MALTAKEAIQAARTHFVDILPEADEIRLEEIERNGGDWAITFSVPSTTFLGGGPFGFGRVAKVIVVDGLTGEFVSLKQRAA